MDNSLLKQVLKEYDEKRTRAIQEAEERKKDLMSVNPRLQEIDKELTLNSIQVSKAILVSDSKEKASLLASLKKKNTSLIK